ncbi:MAG: O-antigen ligase family protein [Acidobacteriia bacterium]|nr:O-antigen ligase family protein [Terriglobia bacterium]
MKRNERVLDGAMGLAALLAYGILTLWVADRWALALYQAAALGACAAFGVWMAVRPTRVAWSALLIPLALIPIWGLAQLAAGRTIYRAETWNSVLNWTVNLASFFLALQILREPRRRQRFLDCLLYFGVAVSILSTVQMFTSEGRIFWLFPSGYSDFVMGPFIYQNQYAAFIETILPLALYRGVTHKKPFGYWAMAGVMVASVVASASRTGTLLVLLEVLVIPLLASVRGLIPGRTAALALGSGIMLSAVFITVVGWGVVWQRFQLADPYGVRRDMLRSSVQMVQERPVMGFGLGTWATAYPAFALYDDGLYANQAHNDWAQWGVEGGLPLLAAMAVFALLLARMAWTSLWGVGLVSLLLHSLVDYPMQQRPALAGWFFAMAGALAAAQVVKRIAVIPKPDSGS